MSIPVITNDTFLRHVSTNALVVVKFGAPWCGPCKALAPLLAKAAQENPDVSFVEVNVDESAGLAAQFGIRALPTTMGWKNGVVQWTLLGLLKPSDLKEHLDQLRA